MAGVAVPLPGRLVRTLKSVAQKLHARLHVKVSRYLPVPHFLHLSGRRNPVISADLLYSWSFFFFLSPHPLVILSTRCERAALPKETVYKQSWCNLCILPHSNFPSNSSVSSRGLLCFPSHENNPSLSWLVEHVFISHTSNIEFTVYDILVGCTLKKKTITTT